MSLALDLQHGVINIVPQCASWSAGLSQEGAHDTLQFGVFWGQMTLIEKIQKSFLIHLSGTCFHMLWQKLENLQTCAWSKPQLFQS